jgi:hypothetical protein
MKKLFIRLLIFGLLFLAVDRCFLVLRNFSPSLEVDKRLEKVINKEIKSDILFFGASRGARDFMAQQIGDSLKMSAYNLSYPGGDIEFQDFVLKQVLKYHKPKMIVMSIDDKSELSASENVTYRYDRLYPLVKYPVVREELIRKDQKNKYLSEVFIFHQLNKSNFDIRQKKFTKDDTIMADGSMPINGQTKIFTKIYQDSSRVYNQKKEFKYKLNCFLDFITLCKKNNIKLVMVLPPNYFKPCDEFYNRIAFLAKNNAFVMKYDISKYKSSDFFNDENHLQKKAAIHFSNDVFQFIKSNNVLAK